MGAQPANGSEYSRHSTEERYEHSDAVPRVYHKRPEHEGEKAQNR